MTAPSSDTPLTKANEWNAGSVAEPEYVVTVEVAAEIERRYLKERADRIEDARMCGIRVSEYLDRIAELERALAAAVAWFDARATPSDLHPPPDWVLAAHQPAEQQGETK